MSYRIPQYRQEVLWREQERQDRYDFKREELETELQDEYIQQMRDIHRRRAEVQSNSTFQRQLREVRARVLNQ